MPFKTKRSRLILPIVEMTPMIDIVFLLIIFFMVAAQFAQESKIDLQLPEEAGEQRQDTTPSALVINIKEDGNIFLEAEKPITLNDLERRIQRLISEESGLWTDVIIRADERAQAFSLNNVLRILNAHGLSGTRIATERP